MKKLFARSLFTLLALSATTSQAVTLAQFVQTNPQYSILRAAIEKANLTGAIVNLRNSTVFAPTNAVFERLPVGMYNALLANPARLRNVLLNHIVATPLTEQQLVTLPNFVPTLAGYPLRGFSENNGGDNRFLYGRVGIDCDRNGRLDMPELVGAVAITTPDVKFDNGVIVQVLDNVQYRGNLPPQAGKNVGLPVDNINLIGLYCQGAF